MTASPAAHPSILDTAREALSHGCAPVPIRKGSKAPVGASWTQHRVTEESIEDEFTGVESIGLILGQASGGLVDIDLDHPISWRIASLFLPPTRMRHGRPGNPNSHYWYRVTDTLPGYRKYTLPGGETVVELRSSSGHQTLIPPSIWYPKKGQSGRPERYRWETEPWGGEDGPTQVTGKQLAARVATLALVTVLVENWPSEGSRHDAYLALAGGMLRFGTEGVHPYWSVALPQVIEAMAEATRDRDGGASRVSEVVPSTEAKLIAGGKVNGWPTLETILGEKSVAKAKKIIDEIESIVDWKRHLPLPSTQAPLIREYPDDGGGEAEPVVAEPLPESETEPEPETAESAETPPLAHDDSWQAINLEPYLAGEITVPTPTVLRRSDGKGMFYPGRVNSLYGKSESAKSWVALYACLQEISIGERALYIDLEDDAAMTIYRMRLMGLGDDDIRYQFMYIRPEGPHSAMQRDTWGNVRINTAGVRNATFLQAAIESHDPGLIVVDGMSMLYGLHGLNTNDVASTDVITQWLKSLTQYGRATVVIIDHTGKGAEKGASPIGSQHKIAMVQGAAIQVVPVIAPRPGIEGHVELVVGKDRPGRVRQYASDDKNQLAADVFIDSTEEDVTRVRIEPPDPNVIRLEEPERPEAKVTKVRKQATVSDYVVRVFEASPGEVYSKAEVKSAIPYSGYSDSVLDKAFKDLVDAGVLLMQGAGSATRYTMPGPTR